MIRVVLPGVFKPPSLVCIPILSRVRLWYLHTTIMIRADRRDSSHAGGSRGTYTHCIEPSCCSRVNRCIQPRRVHGVDAREVTSNPQRSPVVHPSFQLIPLPCAQSRIYRSPSPRMLLSLTCHQPSMCSTPFMCCQRCWPVRVRPALASSRR